MTVSLRWLNPPSPPRRRLEGVRGTRTVRRICAVLLTDANNLGSYTVGMLARTSSVRVYWTLTRFKERGWVETHQESVPPEGFQARRFYRLTDNGRTAAAYLAALEVPVR